jgi:ribosomal protein S16
MVVDTEKAQKWISQGAQPSDAVKRIIEKVSSGNGESEDGAEA